MSQNIQKKKIVFFKKMLHSLKKQLLISVQDIFSKPISKYCLISQNNFLGEISSDNLKIFKIWFKFDEVASEFVSASHAENERHFTLSIFLQKYLETII